MPSISPRRGLIALTTALACVGAPILAASAQASSPAHPAVHQTRPISAAGTTKFDKAALEVGAGATPAARAAAMVRLNTTLPVQVGAYKVQPLWKKGITGKGTSIATIVSFGDPQIQQVIDSYDQSEGLPKAHVTILSPEGPPTCPPGQQSVCDDWAGETDLDIEMFHTLAPGAHLYVVSTPVAETEGLHGFPDMMKAIKYLAAHHTVDVISMSLGATEETFPSAASIKNLDPAFEAAQSAGIPVVAASGDEGATGYKKNGTSVYKHQVVGFPASDPLVTAVGGTVLHISGGHRTSPDSLINFSGGGLSHVFARPSWQDGVKGITKSNMRSMPDVAMEGIEGTSMASPLFAAVLALATQENGGPLGVINPALYAMGPKAAADGLVDLTIGSNTYDGVTGFTCTKGFDVASGWGTINADKFVPALVAQLKSS